MAFQRLSTAGLGTVKTLMGWNQIVKIGSTSGSLKPLRVKNFSIGTKQQTTAPDYVTGAADKGAWTKGQVITEGNISYPFTFGDANSLSGFAMFLKGANLAANPTESFVTYSSLHGTMVNCKVNTTKLSCKMGESIEAESTIWGILDTTNNVSGQNNTQARVLSDDLGSPDGVSASGLEIVQIPMWDNIWITGAPTDMLITEFEIEIDNRLKRNFTMGTQGGASPYGLNATSISAQQREIKGSLTWQSNSFGTIKSIIGAGMESLVIHIGDDVTMTMNNALWDAEPPNLSAGDIVTCKSSFKAIGGVNGFDALIIS